MPQNAPPRLHVVCKLLAHVTAHQCCQHTVDAATVGVQQV